MMSIEAGLNPDGSFVTNSLGYYGPAQFGQAQWTTVRNNNPQLGLPADMHDATADQYSNAMAATLSMNVQGLQAAGIDPTPANAYLAHQLGLAGAISMLSVVPASVRANNPAMYGGISTVGH